MAQGPRPQRMSVGREEEQRLADGEGGSQEEVASAWREEKAVGSAREGRSREE